MLYSHMIINTPSKKETITSFQVKNQLDFNVSQKAFLWVLFPLLPTWKFIAGNSLRAHRDWAG